MALYLFVLSTGSLSASSGSIYYKNENLFEDIDSFRESLGLCPQENRLLPQFSVIDHLLFFGMVCIMNSFENCTYVIINQKIRIVERNVTRGSSERGNVLFDNDGDESKEISLGYATVGRHEKEIMFVDFSDGTTECTNFNY